MLFFTDEEGDNTDVNSYSDILSIQYPGAENAIVLDAVSNYIFNVGGEGIEFYAGIILYLFHNIVNLLHIRMFDIFDITQNIILLSTKNSMILKLKKKVYSLFNC